MPIPFATDPAWFYSSLAQASAAIVGLIGALLGSKIHDRLSVLREKRRSFDELVDVLASQIEARTRALKEYEAVGLREMAADEEALKAGKVTRVLDSELDLSGNARSGGSRSVEISKHLEGLKRNLEAIRGLQKLHIYNPPYEGGFKKSELWWVATQSKKEWYTLALHADLDEITRALGEDIRLFDKFLTQFEHLHSESKEEMSFVAILFFSMIWLFGVGVLWPLSALPGVADPRFSKFGMLVAVSAGLAGLLLWLGSQFGELRGLSEPHWPDEATSFLTAGSTFAARVAAEDERKKQHSSTSEHT